MTGRCEERDGSQVISKPKARGQGEKGDKKQSPCHRARAVAKGRMTIRNKRDNKRVEEIESACPLRGLPSRERRCARVESCITITHTRFLSFPRSKTKRRYPLNRMCEETCLDKRSTFLAS